MHEEQAFEAKGADMAGRPGTAVSDIYLAIRDRIIAGKYPPGLRLSQQQLAEELKVSRTPLREALQKLEAEGLVTGQANRGMEVAAVSLRDVEETYALRLMVEPPTLAAIAAHVTVEDLAQMARTLAEMERPNIATRDFQEAHWRFHGLLLNRYPDPFAPLLRDLYTRLYRHQRLYFPRPVALDDVTRPDRALLDALRHHDGLLAARLLEFHLIDQALTLVLETDPGHEFGALAIALDGLEIEVDGLGGVDGRDGAKPMRWRRSGGIVVPAMHTAHLCYGASTGDRV
jgi:DNA-binding GntR family transcriptional regulator